jgi:hypothetical protein
VPSRRRYASTLAHRTWAASIGARAGILRQTGGQRRGAYGMAWGTRRLGAWGVGKARAGPWEGMCGSADAEASGPAVRADRRAAARRRRSRRSAGAFWQDSVPVCPCLNA